MFARHQNQNNNAHLLPPSSFDFPFHFQTRQFFVHLKPFIFCSHRSYIALHCSAHIQTIICHLSCQNKAFHDITKYIFLCVYTKFISHSHINTAQTISQHYLSPICTNFILKILFDLYEFSIIHPPSLCLLILFKIVDIFLCFYAIFKIIIIDNN